MIKFIFIFMHLFMLQLKFINIEKLFSMFIEKDNNCILVHKGYLLMKHTFNFTIDFNTKFKKFLDCTLHYYTFKVSFLTTIFFIFNNFW